MEINLKTPLTEEKATSLKAGDTILLSGTIYTARDAAHKRLIELVNRGEELPFNIKDEIIYYVGPTPAKPGEVIGSAGPTTSYRMDPYAPTLLDLGLKGMIGKGSRSEEVINAIIRNKGIYFGAIGYNTKERVAIVTNAALLPDTGGAANWLETIRQVRNMVAHHDRFWNETSTRICFSAGVWSGPIRRRAPPRCPPRLV